MGFTAFKRLLLAGSMAASLAFAAAGTPAKTVSAATPVCTGRSSTPSAYSGYVATTASVSCTTSVREIWVQAQLTKNSVTMTSRTCYNTSSCSVSVSAPFSTGGWSSGGSGRAVSLDGLTWTSDWFGGSRSF